MKKKRKPREKCASFMWLPVLEKCSFCFRENDFFRGAFNCHPLQQIRMHPNPYFDRFQRFRFDVLNDFDVKKCVLKGLNFERITDLGAFGSVVGGDI